MAFAAREPHACLVHHGREPARQGAHEVGKLHLLEYVPDVIVACFGPCE